ncbi:MAG: outer membrane protein assembly factor BamA [Hyphomicrobiales bacterium]|nr:outer membrane protein assembly factor BamA [Hyphomicrobiales bacterium]
MYLRKIAVFAACLMLAVAYSSNKEAQAQSGAIIEEIAISGNLRVDAETVLSYLPLSVGDEFDPAALDSALKALYATGLFSDVEISEEGARLVVVVQENPIINRIAFEGNDIIDDETLRTETLLRERATFNRTQVQADTKRIIDLYRRQGRFAARVEPKAINLEQNRIDLVYEIFEGPVTGIRAINFIGNDVFSDSELKEVISTEESNWWNFFVTGDNYDPDRLALDRELLRQFYLNNSYADIRIISGVAELTPDGSDFFITFTLEEGVPYNFGDIEIATDVARLDTEQFLSLIEFETGDPYEAGALEAVISDIILLLGEEGFVFADVRPQVRRNQETQTVDVVFRIEEGQRVYVERINITGNSRTLDEVIRREIELVEKDAFNRALRARSERNIRGLGYFASVEVVEREGSASDLSILDFNVVERATGELSFGIGFSSVDNLVGDISLTERNFRGRGQTVQTRFAYGENRQTLDLRFTEPRFLGRQLSAGIDLFGTETDFQSESSFDERTLGVGVRLGFPLGADWYLTSRYRYLDESVDNVASDASAIVQDAQGDHTRSLLGYTISTDRRDDPINPSEGWYFSFDQDASLPPGSVNFTKQEFRYQYFHEFTENWVGTFRLTGGYVHGLGEDVRLNDRFFKGGTSFRGFERAGVGPRDLRTDDAIGAQAFAIGTVALVMPLPFIPEELALSGNIFTDFGWIGITDNEDEFIESINSNGETILTSTTQIEDDFKPRVGVGVGLFWESPIGPVRFDFSRTLVKEDYDKTERFRFSAGTKF